MKKLKNITWLFILIIILSYLLPTISLGASDNNGLARR